jgi:hypothetical protein
MSAIHAQIGELGLATFMVLAAALLWCAPIRTTHAQENRFPIHLASDWSHRHIVFSQSASFMEALRRPRYEGVLEGDWSQSMGTGASLGAGQYPAKFSFDLRSANCATDFVAFHTGLLAFSSSGWMH